MHIYIKFSPCRPEKDLSCWTNHTFRRLVLFKGSCLQQISKQSREPLEKGDRVCWTIEQTPFGYRADALWLDRLAIHLTKSHTAAVSLGRKAPEH